MNWDVGLLEHVACDAAQDHFDYAAMPVSAHNEAIVLHARVPRIKVWQTITIEGSEVLSWAQNLGRITVVSSMAPIPNLWRWRKRGSTETL
jgi:hypothetical protein